MDNHTVRNVIGEVDQKASLASYANSLAKWCSENEVSTEQVRDAIDKVFDEHTDPNATEPLRLTIPVLEGYAMAHFKVSPQKFSAVKDRIKAFVKGSARFDSSKGKGGGVARLALEGQPIPEKAKKTA